MELHGSHGSAMDNAGTIGGTSSRFRSRRKRAPEQQLLTDKKREQLAPLSEEFTCSDCGDTEWIRDVYGNPPKCGKCSVIAEPLIGERYCFDEHGRKWLIYYEDGLEVFERSSE